MSDTMSAIEYENLEQKYMETKSKLKKTLQYNERYNIQIQKLNKRLKRLENENKALEVQVNQLQSTARDTSESDVSSPSTLHHQRANMIDLIHSKNEQISDLLKDIEESENENIILREKLTETKDQLALATTEIATMTETLKAEEMRVQELNTLIEKVTCEINDLKEDLGTCKREKYTMEEKIKEITEKAREKEIEWKIRMDEKELEIEKLKAQLPPQVTTADSLETSKNVEPLEQDSPTREVDILKVTLEGTEAQLALLKSEMENCTVELKESANIINKLKENRKKLEEKISDGKGNERQLKEQLKKTHERCEHLHKEVEYANKLTKIFETELATIKEQMTEHGQLEIVANLDEVQALKIEKLLQQKQIVGLVRDINKLQEMCNIFGIENVSLRQELGLTPEDPVDVDPIILNEPRKQKKFIEKLQLDNKKCQEDKVKLKLEIKSLKQQITSLTKDSENTQDDAKMEVGRVLSANKLIENQPVEVKALCEENEALRKGLHEILNSVQVKNETSPRELKTDVLEKLLRALDVKHISGWYHPAMRLQAELHTLEGVNIELREQLQVARNELDAFKSVTTPRRDETDKSEKEMQTVDKGSSELQHSILSDLLSSDVMIEKIKINVMKLVMHLTETGTNFDRPLQSDFEYLKQHIDLLHKNCNNEKEEILKNLENAEKTIIESEQLSIDVKMSPEQLVKLVEIERRKANYTFKQMSKLQEELAAIKLNRNTVHTYHMLEMERIIKKLTVLRFKLNFKDKQILNLVNADLFKEVQTSLNENIKSYRQTLTQVEETEDHRSLEINILTQNESDLVKQNNELKENLNKALNKLSQEMYKQDPNVFPLSQKLANAEVQALSEKHRADHTNNLYELVKEQLKKSEEKFVEFSKYGDGLLQKNLVLQERIVVLEDQVTLWIDPELYKELQDNVNSLIKEKEQLLGLNDELARKYHELADSIKHTSTWTKEKGQELLGLKHEIIDLTATSDDKTVIDQLYCDLSKVRSELRDHQMQVEFLRREISNWESRFAKLCSEMEGQRNNFEIERKVLDKKIGILQDVVLKQRIQYHGYAPLTIQEVFVEKLLSINKDKHEAFLILQNAKSLENKLQGPSKTDNMKKQLPHANYDSRNQQIEYLQHKIQNQDRELEKLEKELFAAYQLMDFNKSTKDVSAIRKRAPMLVRELVAQESLDPVIISNEINDEGISATRHQARVVILRNVETQTRKPNEDKENNQLTMARVQLNNLQNQLSIKDNYIADNERLILEKDKELTEAKEQLKHLKNQMAALETSLKNVADRGKNQARVLHHDGAAGDGAGVKSNFLDEQIIALRVSLKAAQDKIRQKDIEIIKYQTLLKEDRDKHSLAAANLQQELIVLRKALVAEQENIKSLQHESMVARQKSVVVDKYVTQVRALEKHLAELHTKLAQLQAQLQNAHQESARWRQMAQDRLAAMQELGKSLNEQHNKELSSYKTVYEKLKEFSEEESPKKPDPEPRHVGYIDPDILKLCREKDEKIEELTAKLKQMESGETIEKNGIHDPASVKDKANIPREHEILRSKYDSMVNRERVLKDENRDLKEQLSKRSNLSARSQKSDRSVKDHLQKKINSLEKEIENLNDKLIQQQLVNEKHKMYANEDFEKWKKQKYWQENCQRYKNRLQEKEEEVQKLQQACSGYRMLIERLEREKINLENRIKSLKSDQRGVVSDHEKMLLKEENDRLACELAMLRAKLEMRQQGAGALGAALMQEKLEAQERKIAVLELSAKGSVEVRNELERLQTGMGNLQKSNLCLEAENLELKMDLEKFSKETPHLQEQIQHLESYIELLKDENQRQASNTADVPRVADSSEDKKVSQLERTVFVLKRVVQKLQAENKRLVSGKRSLSERPPSADKLRRDHLRLKEQYTDSLQQIKELESQLQVAKRVPKNQQLNIKADQFQMQLAEVKEQLLQKTQLLDKVKTLLHSAAAREKQLLKEVAELKSAANVENDYQVDIPSTIEEVSEVSSDV